MKEQCGFLGIDTSNYTTSGAFCTMEGEVIANVKVPLPVKPGERGLRQSDAVFAHTKNLPTVFEQLQPILKEYRLLAVGCSAKPRNGEDSYMPCFLSGVAVGEAVCAANNIPLFRFSHQEGHLMAAVYSSGGSEVLLQAPFIGFHVSGGTTDVTLVCPKEDVGFNITLLGTSADLHAGQAIDRAGVMMGLQFPCGKEMEQLANGFTGAIPKPKISCKNLTCHFSGLENLSQKIWKETGDRGAVSAFVLDFCGATLEKMTEQVCTLYPGLPLLYAGGVMSNRILQKRLGKRENTWFALPAFSADNAAGTALLCRKRYLEESKRV